MGLAAALLMSSIDLAYEIISSVSSFLVSFGMFITIPVVFISFASGTASLMKDRDHAGEMEKRAAELMDHYGRLADVIFDRYFKGA